MGARPGGRSTATSLRVSQDADPVLGQTCRDPGHPRERAGARVAQPRGVQAPVQDRGPVACALQGHVSQQTIRQQARRTARDMATRRRRERDERERRVIDLAKRVIVAIGERDAAVTETERRAGEALRELTEREDLTLGESVEWCGGTITAREARRLRRLANEPPAGYDSDEGGQGAAQANAGAGERVSALCVDDARLTPSGPSASPHGRRASPAAPRTHPGARSRLGDRYRRDARAPGVIVAGGTERRGRRPDVGVFPGAGEFRLARG